MKTEKLRPKRNGKTSWEERSRYETSQRQGANPKETRIEEESY